MRDMPKINVMSLYHIVAEHDKYMSLRLTEDEFLEKALGLTEVHGFGTLVESEIDGKKIYFVSNAQALMITSIFDVNVRMRLIKTLIELGEYGLSDIVSAKVHRQRHKYKEYRHLEDLYQPLVNLINPSFDLESTEATMFLTTRMVNKLCGTNHTCVEVRRRLTKNGFIDSMGRSLKKDIRTVYHHLEFLEEKNVPGIDTPVKGIQVSSLVFDKVITGVLINLFKGD